MLGFNLGQMEKKFREKRIEENSQKDEKKFKIFCQTQAGLGAMSRDIYTPKRPTQDFLASSQRII